MHINAQEAEVVGNAVNNAALPAFPVSQTCELAVRVVECIGANMKRHTHNVDAQIAIVIKMSRNHSEEAGKPGHPCRRHVEPLEKLSQSKPYWPVKIEIEKSLDLTRLVSGFDVRTRRLVLFQHQTSAWSRTQAL